MSQQHSPHAHEKSCYLLRIHAASDSKCFWGRALQRHPGRMEGGKTVELKTWCMRRRGESPARSNDPFQVGSFLWWNCFQVFLLAILTSYRKQSSHCYFFKSTIVFLHIINLSEAELGDNICLPAAALI